MQQLILIAGSPWVGKTAVGDRTLAFALSNYLSSGCSTVICTGVRLLYADVRRAVLREITAQNYRVTAFPLTCSEETLRRRFEQRGGRGLFSAEWLRVPPLPGDIVTDTDGKTPDELVREMKYILDDESRP